MQIIRLVITFFHVSIQSRRGLFPYLIVLFSLRIVIWVFSDLFDRSIINMIWLTKIPISKHDQLINYL